MSTRIEKIIMKNYRQYKNLELVFESEKLHLIKGIMGTGKTNFLNAMNWCLYQEEPYLSRDSQQLPLLNLKTIDDANGGEVKDVIVELWLTFDESNTIVFTRKCSYLIIEGQRKEVTPYKTAEFEVKIKEAGGNYNILREEDAESHVERFVPKKIRDFFFFDGERLDRYFKEATGQNIRHAIFQISQTSLLKRIYENLKKIKDEYEKEAGKLSPNIEFIRSQLENVERQHEERLQMIEQCEKQIKIAKDKKNEYTGKLKGLPDVEDLQNKLDELKQKKKTNGDILKEKIEDKQKLLFEYGKIIFLFPAIEKSIKVINKRREDGDLPPTADKNLLRKIYDSKTCTICGRNFLEGSKEEELVKQLLDGIKLSNEVASDLQNMEGHLIVCGEKYESFKEKVRKITIEIENYVKEIREIEQRIDEIDNRLSGYNEEKIKNWYGELKTFEDIYEKNNQSLGIHKMEVKKLTDDLNELKGKLESEITRVEKVGSLKKYIDFTEKSMEIVNKTRSEVMGQIRKKISDETEKRFFELMWKKETFNTVGISEDYEISLTHKMGYDCLGTISGGEREVLALSFTMALHSISGFDAPILIDRPLAMVSGNPREYIAKILLALANEKQLVLFLTPDDYRDVSEFLNSASCNIHELQMTVDEKEVKARVV